MKNPFEKQGWTQAEAVIFASSLDDWLEKEVDYHVALGGSVLFAGSSEHDLDLLIFPKSTETASSMKDLRNALILAGGTLVFDADTVKRRWRKLGSLDQKHVEIWKFKGRRVDLFFVR